MYSLGVTLWAMLAGRKPPATGPDVTLSAPPKLAEALNSMLARNPSERPTTGQLLETVEGVRRESPDWLKVLGVATALAGGVALGVVGIAALIGALFKKK